MIEVNWLTTISNFLYHQNAFSTTNTIKKRNVSNCSEYFFNMLKHIVFIIYLINKKTLVDKKRAKCATIPAKQIVIEYRVSFNFLVKAKICF